MPYQFRNISVLVVDSQPPVLDLIQGVLNIFGVHKIYTCADGQEALHLFEEHAPDLVLADWDLATMNGLRFTAAVRESRQNPFVPIIFMTAFSSLKRVQAARDAGITEFLRKPFTADGLYKRIEEIIERPRRFIRTPDYFGPDRRRRTVDKYLGVERRLYAPDERHASEWFASGKASGGV